VLLSFVAACSSSSSPSNIPPPNDGGDSQIAADDGVDAIDARDAIGDGGDANASEGAVEVGGGCPTGCTGSAGSGATCVVSADAQLIDPTGAPVTGQIVLLCGLNTCSLPVASDAQGKVHFALCVNMVKPALKVLGGANYASFAAAMSAPTETFPPITLTPLPATGVAFPTTGGTVSSAGVSLQVAAGAVTFDSSQPDDPNSVEFRAASVPLADAPPGLDAALGVKALWALAPANATIAPAAILTVPNPDPTDWTAGTKIDFVMNSIDEDPKAPVAYGTWGLVCTGTVSADGTTISTDVGTGKGLPLTGVIGVAPHS
jgi:hypothetical protein